MHQQLCGVSTRRQPLGLRFGGRVQKAHGDRVEPWGRGRTDDLGGRNWIAGQQQVSPGALQLDCPPHGHLRGLLTPDRVIAVGNGVRCNSSTHSTSGESSGAITARTVDFPTPLAPVIRSNTPATIANDHRAR